MSDRYEIQEKIGQGGIGAVYQAYDTQLKRSVAIKRMLPTDDKMNGREAADAMLKEATTLSALQHPNIVTVYDLGVDDEGPFVVMELLKGETLDQVIKRGVLTLRDFGEVVTQTMEALIAAEAAGVLHRDLKPTNVMVNWLPSKKFQVKILDFSLAKFSKKPSPQTIDQGDAIFGSIYFMAPEQFERGDLDLRTDLYSMGCLYYYCLSGQYPFQGESAAQVMASHLRGSVVSIEKIRSDLPPLICQWVMWLINREPANRPANAKEAFENFNQLTAAIDPSTSPVPLPRIPSLARASEVPLTSRRLIVPPPRQTTSVMNVSSEKTGAGEASPGTSRRPVRGPVPVPTSSGPTTPAVTVMPRKGGGLMTYLGIALGLLFLAVVALGFRVWWQHHGSERDVRRFEALAAQGEPEGMPGDVAVLVRFLAGISGEAVAAELVLRRLRFAPGEDVTIEAALIDALKTARDPRVQERLIGVIRYRQIAAAEDVLLSLTSTEVDPRVTKAAMETLGELGDEHTLERLLDLIRREFRRDLPPGMERALGTIGARLEDREKAVPALADTIASMPGSTRRSLIRVIGRWGGSEAMKVLQGYLNPEETTEESAGDRLAALLALQNWPERTPEAAALAEELMRGPDAVWGLEFYLSLAMVERGDEPSQRSMIETLWTALRTGQDSGEWNGVRRDLVLALPGLGDRPFARDIARQIAGSELVDLLIREMARAALEEMGAGEAGSGKNSG